MKNDSHDRMQQQHKTHSQNNGAGNMKHTAIQKEIIIKKERKYITEKNNGNII